MPGTVYHENLSPTRWPQGHRSHLGTGHTCSLGKTEQKICESQTKTKPNQLENHYGRVTEGLWRSHGTVTRRFREIKWTFLGSGHSHPAFPKSLSHCERGCLVFEQKLSLQRGMSWTTLGNTVVTYNKDQGGKTEDISQRSFSPSFLT